MADQCRIRGQTPPGNRPLSPNGWRTFLPRPVPRPTSSELRRHSSPRSKLRGALVELRDALDATVRPARPTSPGIARC